MFEDKVRCEGVNGFYSATEELQPLEADFMVVGVRRCPSPSHLLLQSSSSSFDDDDDDRHPTIMYRRQLRRCRRRALAPSETAEERRRGYQSDGLPSFLPSFRCRGRS